MATPPFAATGSAAGSGAKLALLSSLYLSQGLPYGFFVQALPVWMRQQGISVEAIGLSSLLMLPWGLKLLIAPWVDHTRGSPLGPRRGWILPLQLLTVLAIGGLALLGASGAPLLALMAAVVVTATLAATQDCATDGLAVTLLSGRERGLGNGVQVGAYRVGMVIGGGGLLLVFARFGWSATFAAMAGLLVIATVPIALYREPRSGTPPPAARSFIAPLGQFIQRRRVPAWLGLIALYKIGDAIGSSMVKPMLVDAKMSTERIALVSGAGGSLVALAGALFGGWLAGRVGRMPALLWGGLLHALLMGGYAIGAGANVDIDTLSVLLALEHFTGSIATVALFTVMMDVADPRQGATEYTLQASAVVIATAIGASLSGFLAKALGYGPFFVVSAIVCVVGTLALVVAIRARWQPEVP